MSDQLLFSNAFSVRFDGAGSAIAIDGPVEDGPEAAGSFTWHHFRREGDGTRAELEALGLDPFVIDALVAEETRPRCTVHGHGAVLNLRGVNLAEGEEPEDMVSVRLWLEKDRIVGVWLRPLFAVRDMLAAAERGEGASSVGDFAARLAMRLADRAEPYIGEVGDRIDAMEEALLDDGEDVSFGDLSSVRRSAIVMRRFLVPQREALSTLEIEDLGWLSERDRMRLREATDRITRLGEELDAVRDRAQIVYDELANRRDELLNRQTLLLSVVAAIFLPLGLLTGLLGINVGGVPGADNPWAFWAVTGGLVVLGVALALWVRKMGLFR